MHGGHNSSSGATPAATVAAGTEWQWQQWECTYVQQKAVELTNEGHSDKPMYLSALSNSQQTHFGQFGELADLENAIFNQQKAVELTDDRHPNVRITVS